MNFYIVFLFFKVQLQFKKEDPWTDTSVEFSLTAQNIQFDINYVKLTENSKIIFT